MKPCPKCGRQMRGGAPHEGDASGACIQWECECGYILVEQKGES